MQKEEVKFMSNDVACVILNYNDYQNTMSLVKVIEHYDIFKQIIVVDNLSTDESLIYLDKLRSDKVSIWSAKKNGGYGAGNNFGIRIAREKYECGFAFISNPDVRFTEECVKDIMNCFDLFPACVVAAPIQLSKDGNVIDMTAWDLPSVTRYIFSAMFFLNKLYSLKKKRLVGKYCGVDCIAGAFLCVKIDEFLSVGGFDEKIFLYCEETVIGFRLKKFGYQSYIVTDQYYRHYHGSGSTYVNIKNNVKRRKMLLSSRLYVINTYMTQSKAVLFLARICYIVAIAEEYIKVLIKLGCKCFVKR